MKKLYNQVTRSEWRESEYAMPIIARYGTGGGNVPIVLQNNQNNATVGETEVCPTLPASMGMGGGYVPMIVQRNMIQMTFNQTSQSAVYRQDDVSVSITCCGGSYGGQRSVGSLRL